MHLKSIVLLAIIFLAPLIHAGVLENLIDTLRLDRQPPRPLYPSSFQVSYNFTLPYERTYLPDGLTLPVQVWRDEEAGKIRMDTYSGVNSLIATKEFNLEISPRIDEMHCARYKVDPGELGLLDIPIFPDISSWRFIGREEVHGQQTHAWEYSKRHQDKHIKYIFHAAKDGSPVRLYMHGNDAFSGAHFDVWIVDYLVYKPGPQDGSVFSPPPSCKGKVAEPAPPVQSFTGQMMALSPSMRIGDSNKSHLSRLLMTGWQPQRSTAVLQRVKALQTNAALVASHNSKKGGSYTLELNRFADWTQEEFETVMLPRHSQERGMVSRHQTSAEIPYKRLAPKGTLPGAVDWRGTPATEYIKDQAACGSCWAFAASGVLEAAHYLASGQRRLFSEQQMMDCSWSYGLNKACDGGDYDAAMDYLKQAGGVVGENAYEYLGADGFCRDKNFSTPELTTFEGYAFVPPGDDEALMEAVYSRGPIAVSLDASQPGFRFYSGGVLDEPNCMWRSEDLDHAVLLVGYGTCPVTGKDYWLIKNSWSTHWGDKGYIKIARHNHGCGITTDPVYAVFNSTNV